MSAGFSVSGSVLQDEIGSLSNVPEEKYISDSLTAGFIRPSSSPAGAGFFLSRRRMVLCDLVLTTEA